VTNCGATGESCCTTLEVPGSGAAGYYRTYTNTGSGPTDEADLAVVSGLRVDKYLVTVGRFRQFVAAWNNGAGYTPPAGSGKHTHLNSGQGLSATAGGFEPGWATTDNSSIQPSDGHLQCDPQYSTWTTGETGDETLPMNCVNWYEGYAFCIWDGGFLPSEAEWEYVAAGGSEQREYPWGATPPGTSSQYAICGNGNNNCYYPNIEACTNVSNIAPVGKATLGGSKWEQLDMVGEVWEWTMDMLNTYLPCTDCVNLTSNADPPVEPFSSRVVRGGVFSADVSTLARYGDVGSGRSADYGFRCARVP
jgi:formylglycine-generating enzyme required for sulfatase activity